MVISNKMLERLRTVLAEEDLDGTTEGTLTWHGYSVIRFVVCKERRKYTKIEVGEKQVSGIVKKDNGGAGVSIIQKVDL